MVSDNIVIPKLTQFGSFTTVLIISHIMCLIARADYWWILGLYDLLTLPCQEAAGSGIAVWCTVGVDNIVVIASGWLWVVKLRIELPIIVMQFMIIVCLPILAFALWFSNWVFGVYWCLEYARLAVVNMFGYWIAAVSFRLSIDAIEVCICVILSIMEYLLL